VFGIDVHYPISCVENTKETIQKKRGKFARNGKFLWNHVVHLAPTLSFTRPHFTAYIHGELEDIRTYGYKAERAALLIYAHFKKEFGFL
jgi:hypothetical protein